MPNSRTEQNTYPASAFPLLEALMIKVPQVTFTRDSYYDDHYEDGTSTTDVWVTPTEDSTVENDLPDYF